MSGDDWKPLSFDFSSPPPPPEEKPDALASGLKSVLGVADLAHAGIGQPDSVELTARKVIMASYLYYVRDSTVITDAEFDSMCCRVSDQWDELSPLRKWQLGDPAAIRASGSHVILTAAGMSGALAWYRSARGAEPESECSLPPYSEWEFSQEHQLHFCPIGKAAF